MWPWGSFLGASGSNPTPLAPESRAVGLARPLLWFGRMRATTIAFIGSFALLGCADDPSGDPSEEGGVKVSGTVRDFRSGDPLESSVSVSTQGLSPAPTATVTGADYVLDNVISDSIFYVLAGAPPTHRQTFGPAVEVDVDDVQGVDIDVVAEDYLGELSDAFGVTPTAATGVLLVQAVDDAGDPAAGVAGSAIVPPSGAVGPFFLDDNLDPDPAANETSASGWVVFFEVESGLVGVTANEAAGISLEMALTPIAPATVSLAKMTYVDGGVDLPTNVSFSQDVRPIFQIRGCENCHSGSGPGRDLANLTLDGSTNLIYRELRQELAVTSQVQMRIDLEDPENSLVLTMPSAEDPADAHPNITFSGPFDPDYLKILVWIREGALEN